MTVNFRLKISQIPFHCCPSPDEVADAIKMSRCRKRTVKLSFKQESL
jgi:hypothetical protein